MKTVIELMQALEGCQAANASLLSTLTVLRNAPELPEPLKSLVVGETALRNRGSFLVANLRDLRVQRVLLLSVVTALVERCGESVDTTEARAALKFCSNAPNWETGGKGACPWCGFLHDPSFSRCSHPLAPTPEQIKSK